VIGFGEAGAAFAHHIGSRLNEPILVADPLLNQRPLTEHMRRRLDQLNGNVVPDVPALAAQCDVLLSLVPPDVAPQVATSATSTFAGDFFVDLNSISPPLKRSTADLFPTGRYVDGAVLGSLSTDVGGVPIALSGPRAESAHAILSSVGLRTQPIDERVGAASAVKLCRSIFMKGVECLFLETVVAASEFDAVEPVMASIEDTFNSLGFQATASMLLTSHAVHCCRRSKEMEGVCRMLEEMSLPSIMSRASEEALQTSCRSGLSNYDHGVVPANPESVVSYVSDFYKNRGRA
jgi:3-hydroxyisobutyrate dehydrogenase-like beta-hydroxyacid dehydrogenase